MSCPRYKAGTFLQGKRPRFHNTGATTNSSAWFSLVNNWSNILNHTQKLVTNPDIFTFSIVLHSFSNSCQFDRMCLENRNVLGRGIQHYAAPLCPTPTELSVLETVLLRI